MKYDSEDIILSMHRHPIVLFFNILPATLFFLLPIALAVIFTFIPVVVPFSDIFIPYLPFIVSIYYLYISRFAFATIFDYLLDRWIITTNHVVNIEQTSLFSRTIAKEEIDRIQDITVESKGILATLFDYGDIYVQTAAERERFEFNEISHPKRVVETISKLLEARKKEHSESEKKESTL